MNMHVNQLQSSLKTVELASTTKAKGLQHELSSKASELASKEIIVKSLENTRDELECQMLQLRSRINALEMDVAARDAELISKEKQVQFLEECKEDLGTRVLQLESNVEKLSQVEADLHFKDDQIDSLESTKAKLESRVSKFQFQIRSLEQDVATKDTELDSKGLLFESLESIKAQLEVQIKQLQNTNGTLEQDLASREVEIKLYKSTVRELENQSAQHESTVRKLEKANISLEAELTSIKAKIMSFEDNTDKLEIQISELKSSNRKLEDELASKNADLTASRAKICSLAEVRDHLLTDLEVAQQEATTAQARTSVFESEVSCKETSLATLRQEHSELQGTVSELMQQVNDQRSALQSANSHSNSLAAENTEVKRRCEQLTTILNEKNAVIKQKEDLVAKYKHDLESKEKLVSELKQRKMTAQSEHGEQIKMLIKDNHVLQSNQMKLLEKLDQAADRERKSSSLCVQLETDLAMERAKSSRLNSKMLDLESVFTTRQENCGYDRSSVAAEFLFDDNVGQSSSMEKTVCGTKSDTEPADDKARVKELKRRNKQALPHLKSSYPIEMQVKPETPTTSNERLKSSSIRTSSTFTAGQKITTYHTSDGDGMDKTGNGEPSSCSNSNPRRISAPPTPQTPADYKRRQLPMERHPVCTSLNLREFLDSGGVSSDVHSSKPPNSMTFDIPFSPPKTKGTLPKRLQENKQCRSIRENTCTDFGSPRRETIVKSSSKKSVTSSSSSSSAGRSASGAKKTYAPLKSKTKFFF